VLLCAKGNYKDRFFFRKGGAAELIAGWVLT
jgi:hypothetical protein